MATICAFGRGYVYAHTWIIMTGKLGRTMRKWSYHLLQDTLEFAYRDYRNYEKLQSKYTISVPKFQSDSFQVQVLTHYNRAKPAQWKTHELTVC